MSNIVLHENEVVLTCSYLKTGGKIAMKSANFSKNTSRKTFTEEISDINNMPISTKDYCFDYDKFRSYLNNSDPMVLVLRCHIYIEYVIVRMIEAYIPFPQHLKIDRLNFINKVNLAKSFGLHEEMYFKSCLEINRVRNKFAHEIEYQVSKEDVAKIYNSMPDFLSEFAQKKADDFCQENSTDDNQKHIVLLRECIDHIVALLEIQRIGKFRQDTFMRNRVDSLKLRPLDVKIY